MAEATEREIEKHEAHGSAAEERKGPHPVNEAALRRLKSIEGQIRGIQRMVEEEKYCVDILTQISAARSALNKVGMMILRRHIEHCVSDAIRSDGMRSHEIIDELMGVLSKEDL
ncbi:MAG: metal-sensitive transcriptional regulator [bacterium]